MTFDEAVQLLRGAGMLVQVGQGAELVTAADPEEPPELVRAQGVKTAYGFGFSLRQIESAWFLHVAPPTPAEQFAELDAAVFRGLEIFRGYRNWHSPREYSDQFATFSAADPCPVLERALVAAGWLQSHDLLDEMGLPYVVGAHFALHFPEEKRVVTVSVDPVGGGSWKLVVRCYRASRTGLGHPQYFRQYDRDGNPVPDPEAPVLSYRVALALHLALATTTSDQRWALHAEPTDRNGKREPIAPMPA